MNKNIDKLAKQCWSHYIDGTLIDGHLHFDYKKFAELIVQECASLTLDHKTDDYYNGWLDYRNEIKKHFGVKE